MVTLKEIEEFLTICTNRQLIKVLLLIVCELLDRLEDKKGAPSMRHAG